MANFIHLKTKTKENIPPRNLEFKCVNRKLLTKT